MPKVNQKLTIFGIFHELLSHQDIDVACFARNIEWDFFCDFQTLFNGASYSSAEKVMNSKGIPFNWVAFCDYTLAARVGFVENYYTLRRAFLSLFTQPSRMDIKKDFWVEQKRLEGQLFWTWNLCKEKEETWWVFDKEKSRRKSLGTTAVKLAFGFCFCHFEKQTTEANIEEKGVFLWFEMKKIRSKVSFEFSRPKQYNFFSKPQCLKIAQKVSALQTKRVKSIHFEWTKVH